MLAPAKLLRILNFPFYLGKNLICPSFFQEESSGADIELKDLSAGSSAGVTAAAMLHDDEEGHFEDMKPGSSLSSSASRSPSYQSANTSIASRDIEIPRSKAF